MIFSPANYSASYIMCRSCWFFHRLLHLNEMNSTAGITSRGRVGIDATLEAQALVEPYLVDPVDRETMIQAIETLVANIQKGRVLMLMLIYRLCSCD